MEDAKNFIKDKAIVVAKEELPRIKESIQDIEINSQESQSLAMEYMANAKQIIKDVDKIRKMFKTPYTDYIKKHLDDPAKSIEDELNACIRMLTTKLDAYQDELEKIKAKEEAKIEKKVEKAVESGKPMPVVPQIHVEKSVKTENVTTSIQENWKAEIINEAEAKKAIIDSGRLELIKIDESALNKFAKMVKDTVTIKGIKIYNKRTFSSRAK